MAIRAANPSDTPQIATLVNLASRVEHFFVYGDRTNADQISAMFQTGTFLLAEIASQPLGCVYLELRGDRAYFGLLSVDPVHQHQGMGRELVGEAERRARDAGCNFMDILIVNVRTWAMSNLAQRPSPPMSRLKFPAIFCECPKICAESGAFSRLRILVYGIVGARQTFGFRLQREPLQLSRDLLGNFF